MRTDILEQAQAIRAATLAAVAHVTEDEDRLGIRVLYDQWEKGKHEVGEVYTAQGQVWECFNAYDNSVYPDIAPGNSAWFTFNRSLHGKSKETAMPFVPVQGAHDMYRAGEYMIYTDGQIYRCKQDTAYSPEDYAAAWERVS